MLDLGWTELLVIGVVALIVIGPKDLPMLFRKVGQYVGKAKGMAREFSRAMDQAADESGMKEATSSFKDMTSSKNMGLDGWDEATKDLKNWDPETEIGKMAAERAEASKKIHEVSTRKAEERLAAQAARAADAKTEAASTAAPKKAAAKKPAAKKAPAKKAAPKTATKTVAKTAAKKPAAKKPAAKKTAPKAAKDSA